MYYKNFLILIIIFCGQFISRGAVYADTLIPWDDVSDEVIGHAEIAIEAAIAGNWDSAYHYARLSDDLVISLIDWIKLRENCPGDSEVKLFQSTHGNWPPIEGLESKQKSISIVTVVSDDDANCECEGVTKKLVFLNTHGFNDEDYFNFVSDLLWKSQIYEAQKMIPTLSKSSAKIIEARIALQNNTQKAELELSSSDFGLIYDYLSWYAKNKSIDQRSISILKSSQNQPLRRNDLYKLNQYYAKEIIYNQQSDYYEDAYALAAKCIEDENLVNRNNSLWLMGWIAFNYLGDMDKAYKSFTHLFNSNLFNKRLDFAAKASKAAYWSGRAAEELGRKGMAFRWYKIASLYSTTFYGQQAQLRSVGKVTLPNNYDNYTAHDYLNCHNNSLAKVAYIALKAGNQQLAIKFLYAAIKKAKSLGEIAIIANLGLKSNAPYVALRSALVAESHGVPLLDGLYPTYAPLESVEVVDDKLILSIIKQESKFSSEMRGSSGEYGLMQVMPATAKDMAKLLKIKFDEQKLNDPLYNITIGNAYIKLMLKMHDDSLFSAIAAYNAGPGNFKKWIKKFGDPKALKSHEEVLVWIEKIPFWTTRDYVQHVLANLQAYNIMLADNK